MAFRTDQVVEHIWLLGVSGTDLSGNMTATLTRYPSGTSEAAASETVTIAKISGAAAYRITYTPENAQTYKLKLEESTLPAEYTWEDDIDSGPDTATANNAYCAEADVVAKVQMGDYTSSTIPTETQVLTFMEDRAGELYAVLAAKMGEYAPGPTGYDTTINTTVDQGRALERQLRMLNSLAAAADALQAAGGSESPSRSARVQEFLDDYQSGLDYLMMLAETYLDEVSGFNTSSNHLTQGLVTKRTDTVVRKEQGRVFTSETSW